MRILTPIDKGKFGGVPQFVEIRSITFKKVVIYPKNPFSAWQISELKCDNRSKQILYIWNRLPANLFGNVRLKDQ